MAIIYDSEPVDTQIFNWSDTIDIEGIFKDINDYLKRNNQMLRLLSGDTNMSISSFGKVSQLTEEEELYLRLLNIKSEDIKKITENGIQNNNIRSFPLGIVKNFPSGILSYNYKNSLFTSVFVYSDSDEEYNKDSEKINNTKRDVTVFNLIEDMISLYLRQCEKIPNSIGTSNICLSRTITISDCKFILYYYYYLFNTLIKYLPRSVIMMILKYRIDNMDNDKKIIPGYDILEKIIDICYDNIDLNDYDSRSKVLDILQEIYFSCIKISDDLDEYEMSMLYDLGGSEEND